jgi:hypothetical protein
MRALGVVQRIRGVFTFINLIWFVSIIGILAALSFLFAPLIVAIMQGVVPLLIALVPLYEVLAYVLCFWFVFRGMFSPNQETGFFISMTGSLGLVPSFFFSTYLHSSGGGNKELFAQILNLVMALYWIPMALHFNSTFFGFLVVCAFWSMLGFSVACYGLCWAIGFHSRENLERCVAASFYILSIFVVLKVSGVNVVYLIPFSTAVSTMGCVVLYLGLLIASSRFYRSDYLQTNLVMIFTLIAGVFFGSVFTVPSMLNTACTFAALYVTEKIGETRIMQSNIWFLALGGFSFLYFISLYLHNHPGFIVSMFDGQGLLNFAVPK